MKIGPVRSGLKARAEGLMALPETAPADMAALLTTGLASEAAKAAPPPPPAPRIEEVEESIAAAEERHAPQPGASIGTGAVGEQIEAIIGDLAQVDGIAFQSASAQYQTFLTRCRRERLIGPMPDMQAFNRRFAIAGAGLDGLAENIQDQIMQLSEGVEEDLLAPFLVIAKAAHAGETQVDEDALARAYGTASPGRIRRLLDHLERQGLIVVREDFGGTRTVLVPGLAGEPAE